MAYIFLILVTFLAIAYPVLTDNCPHPEDISPCSCARQYGTTTLWCKNVEISLSELRKIIYAFDNKVGIHVELHGLKLGTFPSYFFNGFNIKRLKISDCELESLTGDEGLAISGLAYTLERLTITSSLKQDKKLIKLNLSHLRHLTELNIDHNHISEVGNDWFVNGPAQLERLYLYGNDIQIIGDKAFANLPNLRSIVLHGNRLGLMKRSMLPYPATYMHTLYLNDNALTSLPENFLTGLPSLQALYLQKNNFTIIPQSTFQPVWKQLEFIDLRYNPLACNDSNIRWMVEAKATMAMYGSCQSPADRKGMDLKDVIKKVEEH